MGTEVPGGGAPLTIWSNFEPDIVMWNSSQVARLWVSSLHREGMSVGFKSPPTVMLRKNQLYAMLSAEDSTTYDEKGQ